LGAAHQVSGLQFLQRLALVREHREKHIDAFPAPPVLCTGSQGKGQYCILSKQAKDFAYVYQEVF
jgi:hypothetical protein